MADVTHQREDYRNALSSWQMVSDVCAGEKAVKGKGDTYLPRPNPNDKSPENQERYKQYKLRAQFFGATSFTLNGLLGEVFRVDPKLELPALIDYAKDNADGAGVGLFQQTQKTVSEVMQKGRRFIFVDYPETEGVTTRAQQASGQIRAKILTRTAEQVINWKTTVVGSETKLSLVVIEEKQETPTEDGFGEESETIYRVLRLENGVYKVEIHKNDKKSAKWVIDKEYYPTDSSGNNWDEIPGTFIGSKNNDPEIDPIPLYDLASVNLGHYRNSSEYEESIFFTNQPQPVMTGLTESWADKYLSDGIYIGSRSLLMGPANSDFKFVQASPNTLAKEGMDQKEEQMTALGARLVDKGGAAKTVFQTMSENGAQHSVLSVVVANVSEAYTKALVWVARFEGATEEPTIELNNQFLIDELDGPTLTALMALWQGGLLPKSDLQAKLKQAGLIDPAKSQEEIDEETENESAGLGLDDDLSQGGDE